MNTRTGLAFSHTTDGNVLAQYKTHSGTKAQTIIDALTEQAYSVVSLTLFHSNSILIQVVVGKNVQGADYETVRADFKAMWREMRAAQKAELYPPMCGTSALDEIDDEDDELD